MRKATVEELRQDVNNYILSVFSTYYFQLDEDFINDIVKDVIETSNFENGEYSASDISLAFQRVALGRMGCQDFKIYEGDNHES